MDLIKELESQQLKKEMPVINVGDTVRVHVKIKEGSRERIQVFEGIVIAKVETVRSGYVRRAKLYYLRGRVGKAAKIREKL